MVATVVAIGTGLYNYLPATKDKLPHSDIVEQKLAGTVLDEATGEPLQGVVVSLPDFDMKKTTETDGHFQFRVTKEMQAQIKFSAQKEGYKTYANYATLGNTDLRFPMEKGE